MPGNFFSKKRFASSRVNHGEAGGKKVIAPNLFCSCPQIHDANEDNHGDRRRRETADDDQRFTKTATQSSELKEPAVEEPE